MVRTDYRFPMDAEIPDLPGSLRPTSTSPFVGRAAELEKLRTLMPRAEGEGRRVALLAGEPGAGKSRLAREFAGQAATEGALVLYGACDAVVRTPYGPFVEALDRLVRVTEVEELRAALGAGGGELTRLLPDLPALVGELPEPVEADPDTERHRLHTAVADLLANVSRGRPILLVLEDGHWADAPTLLLLRHLARSAWSARLLLLATFRDTEADLPGELSETLADLRRSDDVVRMRLSGLSGAEVSDLVSRAAGSDPDPELRELAATIHDLTGGNAFLVCELWRALVETGIVEVAGGRVRVTRPLTELGTPESVREVVSQRLSRLAPRTTDLLELAAVAGPEFELEPIRRAAGLAEPELLAALEEAVGSGMIEELPSQRLACRFTHEIVRRALYDRLSRLRRAELHLRVGEALESAGAASDRALADLAHHFGAAAPFGGAERAIDYNLRAARAASAALAFDDAADAAAHRDRDRDRGRARARRRPARARRGQPPGGQGDRCAGGLRVGGGDRPRAGQPRAARPGGDRLRGGLLAPRAREPGRGRAARRGAGGGRRRRATSCGSACWPGSPGRSTSRGSASAGRSCAKTPSRWRGGAEDRAGLAKVLVRSYWARGTTPLEEILVDADRGEGPGARSWATPRPTPRRWPGACRPSSPSATSSPPGRRSPPCARWPSGPRSRS